MTKECNQYGECSDREPLCLLILCLLISTGQNCYLANWWKRICFQKGKELWINYHWCKVVLMRERTLLSFLRMTSDGSFRVRKRWIRLTSTIRSSVTSNNKTSWRTLQGQMWKCLSFTLRIRKEWVLFYSVCVGKRDIPRNCKTDHSYLHMTNSNIPKVIFK